jgi:asparagine synthase (glutamine-hydrolysing)
MPGIFGLAGKSQTTDSAAVLDTMAERLRHQPWYQEARHLDETASVALGSMTLGFVNRAAQPAVNEDQSLLAVMDGEIYDYAMQRQALTAAGHRFCSDSAAELLLHGYEEQGQAFFRGLHGKFMAALWDVRRRRLILVNDRFGMRPLYYTHVPGRLVFGAEIKAVLADPAVPRRQNLCGIAQFFTYGQLLDEDTLLEAVRLLPAAGWLTYDVDDDRLTLGRYWRLEGSSVVNNKAECLERIDHAFATAVDRCSAGEGDLGLSLSGGLDARTILGAMNDAVPLQTVCIGMDGSMDQRSAAAMAQLTGRPHRQVLLGEGFLAHFEEHLRQMVRLTDGHYLSQCIVMPTLPTYRELGIRYLLRGHAGELMHMTKAYSFSLDREGLALGSEAALEDWLSRHLQTFMLAGIGSQLFALRHRHQLEDLARASLRACLGESAGMNHLLHRIWHLFVTQRLRRETALSLVKFGSLVETRLPYLDNDLVDALFAAPPELKLDEEIQAYILRRRRPEFLKVTNVNTGTRMGAGRLGRLAGKLRQKVLAKLGVKGYQPYERLGLWLRRELRPLVERLLLSDRCLERGLFDPHAVRTVVANHLSGGNHTFLLLAMMIYEMGQREFVDADAGRATPAAAPRPAAVLASCAGQGER